MCVGRRRLFARCWRRLGITLVVAATASACQSGNPSQVGPAGAESNGGVFGGASATWPSISTIALTGDAADAVVGGPQGPRESAPPDVTIVTDSDSEIGWSQVGDGIERGELLVPADYDAPEGLPFSLSLVRHRATNPDERIGTLLVSPDGPGVPGSTLALTARRLFDPDLLARFDIVGWDARGTGQSTPAIDCIDDYDPFYTSIDRTPSDPSGRQTMLDNTALFYEGCIGRSGPALQQFSTNQSARDIESIRDALEEDKISFLGFGYGAELGATWLTLFPDSARAVVLDAAPDPRADYATRKKQEYAAASDSLQRFFSYCEQNGCGFADSDPAAGYTSLLTTLDQNPLTEGMRSPVNRDVAIGATMEALYDDDDWTALNLSLTAATQGDGSGLLALYDRALERRKNGSYPNDLEAHRVINCIDGPGNVSADDSDKLAAELTELAPELVPQGTLGDYECTDFPTEADRRITIDGGGTDAPIMVIGTVGGPVTPISASKTMASSVGAGAFLAVDANQHIGYDSNRCTVDKVNEALIDLKLPGETSNC